MSRLKKFSDIFPFGSSHSISLIILPLRLFLSPHHAAQPRYHLYAYLFGLCDPKAKSDR